MELNIVILENGLDQRTLYFNSTLLDPRIFLDHFLTYLTRGVFVEG